MSFLQLMKICVLLVGVCVLPVSAAYGAVLTVHISNVQSPKGVVNLAVYARHASGSFPYKGNMIFANPDDVSKPAVLDKMTFTVDIPDGVYALAAYQDINKNGKMDLFLGIPQEPYGFSNDAQGILLPPSFDKASFVVQGDTTVTFKIDK